MIHKIPEIFDSKFRFIVVASERARQIQGGVPPRMETGSRKSAHIAIKEVENGLVDFEILEETGEDKTEEEVPEEE
jgi:DNA-directed RNA polymerase omega subunit